MQSQALLVALCLSSANALQLSRRDLAKSIGIGAATLAPVANAADIKACPKGANNCWSTASTDKTALKPWTFPNKKTAAKELRAALTGDLWALSDRERRALLERVAAAADAHAALAEADLGGRKATVVEFDLVAFAADCQADRLEIKSKRNSFKKPLHGK